jgi:hypothetical protein
MTIDLLVRSRTFDAQVARNLKSCDGEKNPIIVLREKVYMAEVQTVAEQEQKQKRKRKGGSKSKSG